MPGKQRPWSCGGLHLHSQNDLQPDLPGFISRKLRNGFWISGSSSPSIQICSEISFLAVCRRCSEEPLQGLEGRRCRGESQCELTYLDSPQGSWLEKFLSLGVLYCCLHCWLPKPVHHPKWLWLRGKGIQLGWEWPPLLPFLHSGFLSHL